MFAHDYYGVKPDVLTMAKALGCGVPVGAFLVNEKAAVLVPGDHGTTYGGNPLATAAVNKVLEMFEKTKVLDNVNSVSKYLESKLDELTDKYDFVKGHRGKGLMQGIIIDKPLGEIITKCIENGLIIISAGSNVLRLVPPLIITNENVDEMISILSTVLDEYK